MRESNWLIIALALIGVVAFFALKLAAAHEAGAFTQWLEKLSPAFLANAVVGLLLLCAILTGFVFYLMGTREHHK